MGEGADDAHDQPEVGGVVEGQADLADDEATASDDGKEGGDGLKRGDGGVEREL